MAFLCSYALRNAPGAICPCSSCNRRRSQAIRAAGSSWITSLSFCGGFAFPSAFDSVLGPINAKRAPAKATTRTVKTRVLRDADFEVVFFFMGSIWSFSFFFAKVAFWKRGSGRDEEPSGVKVLRLIQDPFNDRVWKKSCRPVKTIPGKLESPIQVPETPLACHPRAERNASVVALRCGGDVIELERAANLKSDESFPSCWRSFSW